MTATTGLAVAGSSEALTCPVCGDMCAHPKEHLSRPEQRDTSLLSPDTPLEKYIELDKWGRRYRLMHAFMGAGVMRWFVDDMGADDDFLIGAILIPSAGADTLDWNTAGECLEIAEWRHDRGREEQGYARRHPADVKVWATELVEQHDYMGRWRRGQSTFGAGNSAGYQRSRRTEAWFPGQTA